MISTSWRKISECQFLEQTFSDIWNRLMIYYARPAAAAGEFLVQNAGLVPFLFVETGFSWVTFLVMAISGIASHILVSDLTLAEMNSSTARRCVKFISWTMLSSEWKALGTSRKKKKSAFFKSETTLKFIMIYI